MSDAPRHLWPRFVVRKHDGAYWLDRIGGSRVGGDQAAAVGPWRDHRKAKRAAQRMNRNNKRMERACRYA